MQPVTVLAACRELQRAADEFVDASLKRRIEADPITVAFLYELGFTSRQNDRLFDNDKFHLYQVIERYRDVTDCPVYMLGGKTLFTKADLIEAMSQ